MVAAALAESLDNPFAWAEGFFFINVEVDGLVCDNVDLG